MDTGRWMVGRVGRFQVMATLQAARARALGLEEDEAKSWGLNRAVFYAAAKRGFRNSGSLPSRSHRAETGPGSSAQSEQRDDHEYVLGGEKTFLAADRGPGLRFQFGDEQQSPRDFEWQVQRRFDDWDEAWSEALSLVKSADPDELNSQRRFYEHVYKPNRDKLAANWSGTPAGAKGRARA